MNQSNSPSVTLENNNIKLQVEKQPGCKVTFTITTLPLATKAAQTAAVKAITKEVNIPGFRKGKAPESVVTSQFEGAIKKEFLDVIARNSFAEAVQLSGIHPLSNNSQVRLTKCDPIDATSYAVTVEFEAYPEIPLVDPSSLSLKHQDPEPVTEDQIKTHIEELQLHHSVKEEVTDRPAQEGDFVTLKIDIADESSEEPLTIHESSRFHLKEGKLPRWLLNLALGLSLDTTATGSSEPENGESAENFKARTFTIHMSKIEQPILPAVDDELAKKAGVETVEALRTAIQKSLERDASNKARQAMRFAIKKSLLEAYPLDLPGERLKELLKECTKVAAEDPQSSKEEQEVTMMRFFNQGKDNMSFSYLLFKMFKDHSLTYPTTQAVRQRATEEMMMRYMRGDHSISENDMEHYTRTAENEIIAETALDFLIEKSKRT